MRESARLAARMAFAVTSDILRTIRPNVAADMCESIAWRLR